MYRRSRFFESPPSARRKVYETELGEAWIGDSRKLLRKLPDSSVDLVFTSPPYALQKQKSYGNEHEKE